MPEIPIINVNLPKPENLVWGENYSKKKDKKNIYKILAYIAIISALIVFFRFAFLAYLYISNLPKINDFDANIESIALTEDGKTAYIKLSGGNQREIESIKFVFKSKDNDYIYETKDGIKEISYETKNSFLSYFAHPEYKGSFDYSINSTDIGLESFRDINKVEVVIKYKDENTGEIKETKTIDSTKKSDINVVRSGGYSGGGGGGGSGSSGGGSPTSSGTTPANPIYNDNEIIINSPKNSWEDNGDILFNISFNTSSIGYGFLDFNNSLVAWYRGDNEANDDSGKSNSCEMKGNTITTNGKFGKAYLFDGNDDYIRCLDSTHPNLNFREFDSFTLSTWVYKKNGLSEGIIIDKGCARPSYSLFYHGSGRYQASVGDGISSATVYAPDTSPENKWTHVASVYDANKKTLSIYLNGEIKMIANASFSGYVDSMSDINIGTNCWGGSDWNGYIDEILFIKKALNNLEIKSLYSGNELISFNEGKELSIYPYNLYGIRFDGTKKIVSKTVLYDYKNSIPDVTLTNPLDKTRKSSSIEFECNIRNTNQDTQLTNVTLYLGPISNMIPIESKIISGNENKVTFSKTGLSESSYIWNCLACDTNGNCGFSKNNNNLVIGRNDYYISKNGNDNNPGTLSSPFLTIQKCADIALAGDTCYIRSGTYRETINIKNSGNNLARIYFKSYNNEDVIVSGSEPINGWVQYSENIYKTNTQLDLGWSKNQVFMNNKMLFLARFPNTPTLDVSRPIKYPIESGSNISGMSVYELYNSNLSQNTGTWINAKIHYTYSPKYWTYTGTITSSEPGKIIFQSHNGGYGSYPSYGSFYIMDDLDALDSEGEWYYNNITNELFVYPIGGGIPQNIEAKKRQLAFNLSNQSYITIENIKIFSAGLFMGKDSHDNILNNIDAKYVFHEIELDSSYSYHAKSSGIMIDGKNNILTNSKIQYSSCNGVSLDGEGHIISFNEISDADYMANYCGTISTTGRRVKNLYIHHNKLHDSGREVLTHANAQSLKLLYNEMYNSNVGGMTWDLGVTYANSNDYLGTEIAYNRIYNSPYAGIYLDYKGMNVSIHHNIVFNTSYAILIHSPENYIIDHNTLVSSGNSIAGGWFVAGETPVQGKIYAKIRNNIFTGNVLEQSYYKLENNLDKLTNPVFINDKNNDYHLQASSPAIDKGLNLGYTKDIEDNNIPYGNGFDLGAYECQLDPTKSGPISHWNFEVSADDSIGNNHGSFQGDAKIINDIQKGNVLNLDGSGDYVNLPQDILFGRNELSFTGWFKTLDNSGSIIMQYDNSGTYVYFINLYNGKVEICMSNSDQNDCRNADISSNNNYNDGSWHHIAAVSDGQNEILYIDAIEIARISKSVHLYQGYYMNTIGLQGYSSANPLRAGYLNGSIDDVMIYGRALSSDEITNLYNNQKPV